jgi:5-methyltetrahydropteroyltriglutamate--homocysteine methyltransferase
MTSRADRVLTTHAGSLPRPPALFELLLAEHLGNPVDAAALRQSISQAVAAVVKQQNTCGIDILGDGETSKASYTHYVKHRLSGIVTAGPGVPTQPATVPRDLADHPDLMEIQAAGRGTARSLFGTLVCEGPVSYVDTAPLKRDLADLSAATAAIAPAAAFITSASPGTLAHFIRDLHYRDEDRLVTDLAEAMRTEYEAIYRAGFVLQVDCPDLAMSWHISASDRTEQAFLRAVARNVEALNHATRNIPGEAVRIHICWGNYPGPHTHDIALSKIIDLILTAKPQSILFEGANPRHEHEWEAWQAARIPDDKILVPGVIDTTTNFVEHPQLVSQRIQRYADIVGRDRVIAGTDCGFGTVAGRDVVAPSVVWRKLEALATGARIASEALWRRNQTVAEKAAFGR